MCAVQLTLERDKIQIGEPEIVRCRGCEKTIIRNKGSAAFGKEDDEYFYCAGCQRNLEREIKWIEGYHIKIPKIKKS